MCINKLSIIISRRLNARNSMPLTVDEGRKGLKFSRDKNEGACRSGEGGDKSLLSDSGSELTSKEGDGERRQCEDDKMG